ncbi:MAG: DoxX family protein [Hyphomicrobium sp.]|uniref:DoxX family protein n=1 Tax=Hyphomicrobium sp. TaxID=82 RepID=UPI0039E43922
MNDIFACEKLRDPLILLSRILLALLFIIFGWQKLVGFGATEGYFTQLGLPLPFVATIIAVVMEFFVGVAIVLGFFTRPLAILLAFYTLATAIVGHAFWTMTGQAAIESEINFYKNVGIIGGLFLLYVTGPGRFSLDRILKLA